MGIAQNLYEIVLLLLNKEIDLILYLKHESSIAIDDINNEAREDYFAMASAEVASAEEDYLEL